MSTLPTGFAYLIAPFAPLFSKRVFQSVQVLIMGTILATGKRTVTAVLRIIESAFCPRRRQRQSIRRDDLDAKSRHLVPVHCPGAQQAGVRLSGHHEHASIGIC